MSAQKPSVCAVMLFLVLGWVNVVWAQSAPATPAAGTASTAVPRLVKFSGVVKDAAGNPRTGVVGMTFALYQGQAGGTALWLETQNVSLDAQGRYTVLLGANSADGVPLDAFTANEAQWLGIQPEGLPEQRVLLVSVPYALKAADAETLGGIPASSFVLAAPPAAGTATGQTATTAPAAGTLVPSPAITGSGTVNTLAKFDASTTNLVSSSISDTGTAVSTLEPVGIGTASPGALLDVEFTTSAPTNALLSNINYNNSTAVTNAVVSAFDMNFMDSSTAANLSKQTARIALIRQPGATGTVTAFDTALTATEFLHASAPYPIRGINIEGPTMDSGTSLSFFTGLYIGSPSGAGTVTNKYALVTEPNAGNVGIGTTSPTVPLEVAGNLTVDSPGIITGNGAGLTNLNAASLSTGMIASSALNGVNGSGLTNVNAAMLGGFLPGAFATTGANTFTGSQSVTGNLSLTGSLTGGAASLNSIALPNTTSASVGVITLGGAPFMHNFGTDNTFVGAAAGNLSMSGAGNSAFGFAALNANTTGIENSAFGNSALALNNTGYGNSAFGNGALTQNTTGCCNSAFGDFALTGLTTGVGNIAIGYQAGYNLTAAENNNIYIGNAGVAGESGIIRIGSTQTATFLVGNVNFTGNQTFTGTQTIDGNLSLPNTTSGGTQGVIDMGGAPFIHDYGPSGSYNAFLGFHAGNLTTTGGGLTATGDYALAGNTSGIQNTAAGSFALISNTSGSENTAVGYDALTSNTTGGLNTALGYNAGPSAATLNNTTAIGAEAVVSESNALVLGGTGIYAINVGIGTATPASTLDVRGTGNFTGAVTLASATGNALSATSSNLSGSAVYALNTATSGTNFGLYAQTTGPQSDGVYAVGGYFGVSGNISSTAAGAAGVVGQANGTSGQTIGAYGLNFSTTAGSAGVAGNAAGSSGNTFGVYGENASPTGTGVYGVAVGPSVTGSSFAGKGAYGVWGDTVNASSTGVLATADNGFALYAENNCEGCATLVAQNLNATGGYALIADGPVSGTCLIGGGDLQCTGSKSAVVPVEGGKRKVALYAVEAPENWFEDFGSGQLANGAATVALDSVYAQTVNTDAEYHVFLTPRGECEGLYVGATAAGSFEVRELHHGTSNVKFDYRIVARRKGYEDIRLADKTEQLGKLGAFLEHGPVQKSVAQK